MDTIARLRRSPRKYWEGKGRRVLMIPSKSIHRLLSKNRFLNIIYITDIGYYPNAVSHFIERKKGSPENILFYCAGGKGWYETEEGYFTVGPNQFFILPANRYHRYGSDEANPWTIYWVMFESNLADGSNLSQYIRYCRKPSTLPDPQKFIELFDNIIHTLSPGFTFENLLLANMNLWLMIMHFGFVRDSNRKAADKTPVEKIIALMKENIHRKLSIGEIATAVSYSSSHIYNLFRSATGYSPLDYFIHLKMQHACNCLINTSLRVNEIAASVGYDDPYLFSRIFTKAIGLSPQKYRLSNKV